MLRENSTAVWCTEQSAYVIPGRREVASPEIHNPGLSIAFPPVVMDSGLASCARAPE